MRATGLGRRGAKQGCGLGWGYHEPNPTVNLSLNLTTEALLRTTQPHAFAIPTRGATGWGLSDAGGRRWVKEVGARGGGDLLEDVASNPQNVIL